MADIIIDIIFIKFPLEDNSIKFYFYIAYSSTHKHSVKQKYFDIYFFFTVNVHRYLCLIRYNPFLSEFVSLNEARPYRIKIDLPGVDLLE